MSDFTEPPRDIGVLAVKTDIRVIAADLFEGAATDDEVASLKDRADVKNETDEKIKDQSDVIEYPCDEANFPWRVVEDERAGESDELRISRKFFHHLFYPSWRDARIGIHVCDQLS